MLRIDTTLSDWLLTELASWYDTTQGEDTTRTDRLQKRASELRAMMRASYEDKLLGNIEEDIWRYHHELWQRDLDEIDTLIRTSTISMPREEFLRRAKRPLELLQTAADQYVAQTT